MILCIVQHSLDLLSLIIGSRRVSLKNDECSVFLLLIEFWKLKVICASVYGAHQGRILHDAGMRISDSWLDMMNSSWSIISSLSFFLPLSSDVLSRLRWSAFFPSFVGKNQICQCMYHQQFNPNTSDDFPTFPFFTLPSGQCKVRSRVRVSPISLPMSRKVEAIDMKK